MAYDMFLTIIGLFSLGLIVGSIMMIGCIFTNFKNKKIKKILNGFMMSFILMMIPYSLYVVQEILHLNIEQIETNWIIFIFMIFVSISIFRTAFLLRKYS